MAAPSALDWLFMDSWFQTLEEAGLRGEQDESTDSDDVRVGRDPGDETWIGVGLTRETLDVDHEGEDDDGEGEDGWEQHPGVAVRLRRLREAMVLTSLVGRTDYDHWLMMMREHAAFDVPNHYKVPVNGVLLPVPIQFYFELHSDHPVEFFDWPTCFRHLLGNQQLSDEFQSDLSEISRLLTQRGVSLQDLEPISVKIGISLEGALHWDQAMTRRIMRLVDSIQRTQNMEEAARSAGQTCSTLFKIVSVEVDLSEVYIHDSIVASLVSLFQVGVKVDLLRLPKLGRRRPAMTHWGPFVRLITGIDRDDEGRLASATRIELPVDYAGTIYFASICSALACAEGVEEFALLGAQDRAQIDADSDERDHMWRWLAFVFHNEVATTSIRTLIIDGERPFGHEIMSFQAAIISSDPFALLGHIAFEGLAAETGPEEGEYAFSHMWLPQNTVLCIRDDTWSGDCQLRRDLKAEVFLSSSVNGDARLFVPGYGFCLAERPKPSAKRPKLGMIFKQLEATLPLTSLVLRPGNELGKGEVKDLLFLIKLIGPYLRLLRVEANLDEDAMKRVLSFCPQLTSLAVENVSLPSLAVFEEAYASGAQISSLSLDSMDVPIAAVDAFVHTLANKNPSKDSVAGTLERLYWGSRWPDHSVDTTLALFTSVLEENPILTHLHGMFSASQRPPEELTQYHGKRLPGLNFSQRAQLMAFLGGVRALATRSAVITMDAYIKHRIWEFAITPCYRNVSWTADQTNRFQAF